MRVEQLRSFVAVYEEGTFTAAAGRLYTEQPVVTKHVAQLEQELGITLFTRTTRRVAPTQAGDLFYEKAHDALRLIDEGIDELKALQDSQRAKVSIGFEYLYMDVTGLPMVEEYEKLHEDVSLNIVEQTGSQLMDGVFDGILDCIFLGRTSEDLIPAYLERRPIITSDEFLLVSKTHPLAAREFVTIQDVLDESFIYPQTKPTSRESLVIRDFEDLGRKQRAKVTTHQPSALKVVARGEAVMNLPEPYGISGPDFVRVPYRSERRTTYYIIWNRNNDSVAFRDFLAFIEGKIAAMPV